MNGTATTATVAAGSVVGLNVDGNPSTLYHPGVSGHENDKIVTDGIDQVLNVYMAQAPSTGVAGWTPTGDVWFKVYEIRSVLDTHLCAALRLY